MRLGETIEELAKLFPNDPFLHYSLGKYFRKKKMYADARKSIRQTLDSNSFYLPAYEEIINLNEEQEMLDKTSAEFSSLVEELKSKDRYRCQYCRSEYSTMQWCCKNCGRWETIIRDLEFLSEEAQNENPSEFKARRI